MSNINVLAVSHGQPIRTKVSLREALANTPESIKFLPADQPTPGTEQFRTTGDSVPFGIPFTVHGRFGKREWSATVERKFNGAYTVK